MSHAGTAKRQVPDPLSGRRRRGWGEGGGVTATSNERTPSYESVLVGAALAAIHRGIAYMDSSRFASDCRFGVGYECTRISGLFR